MVEKLLRSTVKNLRSSEELREFGQLLQGLCSDPFEKDNLLSQALKECYSSGAHKGDLESDLAMVREVLPEFSVRSEKKVYSRHKPRDSPLRTVQIKSGGGIAIKNLDRLSLDEISSVKAVLEKAVSLSRVPIREINLEIRGVLGRTQKTKRFIELSQQLYDLKKCV